MGESCFWGCVRAEAVGVTIPSSRPSPPGRRRMRFSVSAMASVGFAERCDSEDRGCVRMRPFFFNL